MRAEKVEPRAENSPLSNEGATDETKEGRSALSLAKQSIAIRIRGRERMSLHSRAGDIREYDVPWSAKERRGMERRGGGGGGYGMSIAPSLSLGLAEIHGQMARLPRQMLRPPVVMGITRELSQIHSPLPVPA